MSIYLMIAAVGFFVLACSRNLWRLVALPLQNRRAYLEYREALEADGWQDDFRSYLYDTGTSIHIVGDIEHASESGRSQSLTGIQRLLDNMSVIVPSYEKRMFHFAWGLWEKIFLSLFALSSAGFGGVAVHQGSLANHTALIVSQSVLHPVPRPRVQPRPRPVVKKVIRLLPPKALFSWYMANATDQYLSDRRVTCSAPQHHPGRKVRVKCQLLGKKCTLIRPYIADLVQRKRLGPKHLFYCKMK